MLCRLQRRCLLAHLPCPPRLCLAHRPVLIRCSSATIATSSNAPLPLGFQVTLSFANGSAGSVNLWSYPRCEFLFRARACARSLSSLREGGLMDTADRDTYTGPNTRAHAYTYATRTRDHRGCGPCESGATAVLPDTADTRRRGGWRNNALREGRLNWWREGGRKGRREGRRAAKSQLQGY